MRDDLAHLRVRLGLLVNEIVDDARLARVHVGAAEALGVDDLVERRLHDRRSAEVDAADPLDDHRLIAERRHVGAPGGAAAEHDRDLRQARGGKRRLVVKRAAEMLLVGKHLVLQRQKRAAAVDQIDARQSVFGGDPLGPEVLLDRLGKERAAFHGRVVGDEHAGHAVNAADPGDDAAARRSVAVLPPRGKRRELEERRVLVDDEIDPLTHHELSAGSVARDLRRPVALEDEALPLAERGQQLLVASLMLAKARRTRVDAATQTHRHFSRRRGR